MKQSEIKVGVTYHNGKGKQRTVERIDTDSYEEPYDVVYSLPEKPGVIYGKIYACNFVKWAKGVVEPPND